MIPSTTPVVDLNNSSMGFFKKQQLFIQTLPPVHANDTDVRYGLTIFVVFDESNLMNNTH